MRLFGKLVFICNICFIVAVVLRMVELLNRFRGDFSDTLSIQSLQSTIIIVGTGAIFLNALFFLLTLMHMAKRKLSLLPKWIVLFNLFLFPLQVWYFFFSNS